MSGFRVITRLSSIGCENGDVAGLSATTGLTAGMLRTLAKEVLYVWGAVPAMVSAPDKYTPEDDLTTEFGLLLMCYPHAARPPMHSPLWSEVHPDQLETEPLMFAIAKRPEGWPR